MKKLIFIGILCFSPMLFAQVDIGVRINGNIGNSNVNVGISSDNHKYQKKYRKFNYKRHGYYDNFGFYYGFFDRTGYFFDNVFFRYDSRYTYNDRLHKRGFFKPRHAHFHKYKHSKKNKWNKVNKHKKYYGKTHARNYSSNPKNYKKFEKNYKIKRYENQRIDKNFKNQKKAYAGKPYRPNSRYER